MNKASVALLAIAAGLAMTTYGPRPSLHVTPAHLVARGPSKRGRGHATPRALRRARKARVLMARQRANRK